MSSTPLAPRANQWQDWFLNPLQPVVDFASDIYTKSAKLFDSPVPDDNSAIDSYIQAKESEADGQLELAHSQYVAAFMSASMQKRYNEKFMERILKKLNKLRHRLGMENYFG